MSSSQIVHFDYHTFAGGHSVWKNSPRFVGESFLIADNPRIVAYDQPSDCAT